MHVKPCIRTSKPLQQTLICVSSLVAIQCLHIRKALQLSWNPPSSKLPKLSADITAIVPNMAVCFHQIQIERLFPTHNYKLLTRAHLLIPCFTSFLTSSIIGFKISSMPYNEIILDFTMARRWMFDKWDLYLGARLPKVK